MATTARLLLPLRDGGNAPAPATDGSLAIVWFRTDLRLDDHPALNHALEEADRILPVYCFDPRRFGKTTFGFEKTGRYRAKFLIEAVEALRNALRERGSDLLVRIGHPEEVLPDLCKRTGASMLMYHREVSYEDKQVEVALDKALSNSKTACSAFWGGLLYNVDDLPFHLHDMPLVYTAYREAVLRDGHIRKPLPAPDEMPRLPKVAVGAVPRLKDFGLEEPKQCGEGMYRFRGGEDEALSRLESYVNESTTFPDGRSAAVHLGADFNCKISPWLALGCISPRRIYHDLASRAAKAGLTATYFELIWRDFFKYLHACQSLQRCVAENVNQPRRLASATPGGV